MSDPGPSSGHTHPQSRGWIAIRNALRSRTLLHRRNSATRQRKHNRLQKRDSFMERFSTQRGGSTTLAPIVQKAGAAETKPGKNGAYQSSQPDQSTVAEKFNAIFKTAIHDNHAGITDGIESTSKYGNLTNSQQKKIFDFTPTDEPKENSLADICLFPSHSIRLLIWLTIVSGAVSYNLWFAIARQVFRDFGDRFREIWISLDLAADLIYILDIVIQSRSTYLEHGLIVRDAKKLCKNYVKSRSFKLDLISLIPLDLLQLKLGVQPLLRCTRFVKLYRANEWKMKIENRSLVPNAWRVLILIQILFLCCHWFGCIYYAISKSQNFSTDWGYRTEGDPEQVTPMTYFVCIYWATLALTTIGIEEGPTTNPEFIFTCLAYLVGLFVFAAVVGQVGNIINTKNAARIAFEEVLDNVKTYMRKNSIDSDLQKRILRWYDYAWIKKTNGLLDLNTLAMLPDKLKTELAININLATLKRVSIFKECRPEFLNDLVLKMRPYIFIPGDYICRKGEVAREMFIVADGVVQVLGPNNTVIKELKSGDFFGEIGILQLAGSKRRTADVRAVGYADLFVLSRADVLAALEDHPEAEVYMLRAARERFMETTQSKDVKFECKNIPENTESSLLPKTTSLQAVVESMMEKRKSEFEVAEKDLDDSVSIESELMEIRNKCEDVAEILQSIMTDLSKLYERRVTQSTEKLETVVERE